MKYYDENSHDGKFISISTKALLSGIILYTISILMFMLKMVLNRVQILSSTLPKMYQILEFCGFTTFICGTIFLASATALYTMLPKNLYIAWLVRRALSSPPRGNPLGLGDGDLLPRVSCSGKASKYNLKIWTENFDPDEIKKLAPIISSSLTGRVKDFSVTAVSEDEARNSVNFLIEDVMQNYQYSFDDFQQFIDVCRTLPPPQSYSYKRELQ